MKAHEIIQVSLEGLSANKLRSALTILGVIIGVAAIVLLTSLSLEVRNQVTGGIKSLGSNLYFVFPADPKKQPLAYVTSKLREWHARTIAQENSFGIVTSPVLNKTALIKYGKQSRTTSIITGTTPNFTAVREWKVGKGRFIGKSDLVSNRKVCVLGHSVCQDLFRGVDPVGRKIVINGRNFQVIGLMEKKGLLFNINQDDYVFIPLTTAQNFSAPP